MKRPRFDAYYTPSNIAEAIAELAVEDLGDHLSVIDVAAGEGALLRAVAKIADCRAIGAVDIDPETVALLRLRFPDWTVSKCDSLLPRSISASKLAGSRGQWDLAVLNPPFSCRGMKTYTTKVFGETVETTLALAFVLVALKEVKGSGRVVAILPQGSQLSQKDAAGWALIRSRASVAVAGRYPRGTFPLATAATEVVVIDRHTVDPSCVSETMSESGTSSASVQIVRGWVKLHLREADLGGLPLVHTTNLGRTEILKDAELVVSRRSVSGPALLVPRVGKPDLAKVRVLDTGSNVALSDCVFAVAMQSMGAANDLLRRIASEWTQFSALYVGPCAPHVTKARLEEYLAH